MPPVHVQADSHAFSHKLSVPDIKSMFGISIRPLTALCCSVSVFSFSRALSGSPSFWGQVTGNPE